MEVEVKFEPSGRNGIVAAGTYLYDAAARFGVLIENDCQRKGDCDSCAVKILKGGNLLSEPTKAELEHLNPERRKKGERLSCQAKIEKNGEITVMTTEKPKPEIPEFEKFKKDFATLSLEEKVSKLVDLEAIALSDTFSFLLNLPYTIGEKIRDGIAHFGFKMEEAEKQAKRPAEHKTEDKPEEKVKEKSSDAVKATAKKTTTPKKPTASKKAATTAKKPSTRKPAAKTASEPRIKDTPEA